jgi:hypothetical protein
MILKRDLLLNCERQRERERERQRERERERDLLLNCDTQERPAADAQV